MISVVCVYNNERTLRNVLLKSLKNQTVEFELITIDNTDNRYRSAAEALNCGGEKAKGDYIMFVHHDMWLGSNSWLQEAERTLASIPDLGIAGVAGMSENGRNWQERCRFSIELFGEGSGVGGPVERPEEVQTMDECLLIVPRAVFGKLKFDEKVFDGWHCYGADYCLSVRELGLRSYVIPGSCSHSCIRANLANLPKYLERLYIKHRKNCKHIYTWTGDVSWLQLRLDLVMRVLRHIYYRLFPDVATVLAAALSGCDSILDLGCGNHSQLVRTGVLSSVDLSVGVELFGPSLQESKRKRIHSQYIQADARRVEFRPKSFDAVVAIELLEHLTKEEGTELLGKMEKWAKRKVVITTPNGYVWQDDCGGNPFQEHRCGWSAEELRQSGFEVFGLCGWKRLRGYKSSFKYRPALMWWVISDLTQKIAYHYPKLAFDLLAIRRVDETDSQ